MRRGYPQRSFVLCLLSLARLDVESASSWHASAVAPSFLLGARVLSSPSPNGSFVWGRVRSAPHASSSGQFSSLSCHSPAISVPPSRVPHSTAAPALHARACDDCTRTRDERCCPRLSCALSESHAGALGAGARTAIYNSLWLYTGIHVMQRCFLLGVCHATVTRSDARFAVALLVRAVAYRNGSR